MKIFLSGYMGSGKSIVGSFLGKRLNIPSFDLDSEIEKTEKMSVRDIFKKKGEIYFRRVEAKLIKKWADSDETFIMALGGGTPCYGNNLQLLKEGKDSKIVFLKTSSTELTSRLFKEREKRPLISNLSSAEALEEFIRKHLFERNFYYNQADVIISTDEKTPEEVAKEILQQLN